MKRIFLILGMLGALGATAASAQTRVSVSVGFGVPAPYVVYEPGYHYGYIRYRPLVVVRRPAYRPARVVVVRRPAVIVRKHWRRHHRRHW